MQIYYYYCDWMQLIGLIKRHTILHILLISRIFIEEMDCFLKSPETVNASTFFFFYTYCLLGSLASVE